MLRVEPDRLARDLRDVRVECLQYVFRDHFDPYRSIEDRGSELV